MAVKIRLRRLGGKRDAFYRIVVADSRTPRDGRFIEEIGFYDPVERPARVRIEGDRARYWLSQGARPSETVRDIFLSAGLLEGGREVSEGEQKSFNIQLRGTTEEVESEATGASDEGK